MGTLGIYSGDGSVHRGSAINPILDSISEVVLSGAQELQIVSAKPLADSEPTVMMRNNDAWIELAAQPELNGWVTHSRLRIAAGIPIDDVTTPMIEGVVAFSDGAEIWTYALELRQNEIEETVNMRLTQRANTGESVRREISTPAHTPPAIGK